ncbi:pyridoxamine 5'-phosphate oxidase family protein [Fodinicola feengrottensis]|uniref:Pyridoxamine 5'-phosphate oxidase family protein n=1 Tax=Fodinicola feengrottensis TaxID=435914 RepID=A0ABN2HXG8_9ACTN
MPDLETIAPAFVEVAHSIVWATVATVDSAGRPRTRVLHPYWEWKDGELTGYVATWQTPVKKAHLAKSPYASVAYRAEGYGDCAIAECAAAFAPDDAIRTKVWNFFQNTPEPLGYDPAAIGVPGWDGPTSPAFSVLEFRPWRLSVLTKDTLMTKGPAGAVSWP